MESEEPNFMYYPGAVLEVTVPTQISTGDYANTTVLMNRSRWEVIDQCKLPTGEPYYKLKEWFSGAPPDKDNIIKLIGTCVESSRFQPFDAAAFKKQKTLEGFCMDGIAATGVFLPNSNSKN